MLSQSLENRVSSVKMPVIVAVATAAIVMGLSTVDDLSGIIINAIATIFMAILIIGPVVIVGIAIRMANKSKQASTAGKLKQLTKKQIALNEERDYLSKREIYLTELAAMKEHAERVAAMESSV